MIAVCMQYDFVPYSFPPDFLEGNATIQGCVRYAFIEFITFWIYVTNFLYESYEFEIDAMSFYPLLCIVAFPFSETLQKYFLSSFYWFDVVVKSNSITWGFGNTFNTSLIQISC